MSYIRLRFRAPSDDVVDAVERAGLPVRGPSGRIYVLHEDGTVTQHPTAAQATFALTGRAGSELLAWLVGDDAVAVTLAREETRLVCRFDLAGVDADSARTIAAAVDALLILLEANFDDVDVDAVLPH